MSSTTTVTGRIAAYSEMWARVAAVLGVAVCLFSLPALVVVQALAPTAVGYTLLAIGGAVFARAAGFALFDTELETDALQTLFPPPLPNVVLVRLIAGLYAPLAARYSVSVGIGTGLALLLAPTTPLGALALAVLWPAIELELGGLSEWLQPGIVAYHLVTRIERAAGILPEETRALLEEIGGHRLS